MGKEASVTLDWSDKAALRELLRKRLVAQLPNHDIPFETVWHMISDPFINGEESSEHIIDRCLMRPRALLQCLMTCRGIAINRGKTTIGEEDFQHGLHLYSRDLLRDISYEIRDIFPGIDDALYLFVGTSGLFSRDKLLMMFLEANIPDEHWEDLIDILLWHGVLGFKKSNDEAEFIFDTSYDLKLLKARNRVSSDTEEVFLINRAFYPSIIK